MARNNIGIVCYGNGNFVDSFKNALSKRFDEDVLVPITTETFANKEHYARIDENIRRKSVYFVSNLAGYGGSDFDPNVGYMRIFVINDAIKRASPNENNNVLPFVPYLRQDRRDRPRSPISARLFANLLQASGAERLSTVDMHNSAIEGFYDIPVDNIRAIPHLASELIEEDYGINQDDWAIVSPDAGGMERAKFLKTLLYQNHGIDLKIALTEKTRGHEREPEVQYVVGDVDGRNVVLIDDMIDSAGTLGEGSRKLIDKGAGRIVAVCTHGLFSQKKNRKAEDRLREAGISVLCTDSIPRHEDYLKENADWLIVTSIAPLIAEAIYRIDTGGSVEELKTRNKYLSSNR